MFVTYFVVKLAMQAVLDECNRLAALAETQERANFLKSKIARLELDFAKGEIDEKQYTEMASEILREVNTVGGGTQGSP